MATATGLIDKPGGRKTHHGEIPVVGGMAMFAGLLVAAVGGQGLGHGGTSLLMVAAFMVALGVLDDLSASVALVYGTEFAFRSLGDLLGTGPIGLGIFSLPFTVFAVVALINAFNMLDGLDGLAGSAGLVAFGGVMYVSSVAGSDSTLLVAGSMFGAVAAFLLFNLPLEFNRAMRTFMGDAGSTLLGFVMAGLAMKLAQPRPDSVALSPIVVLWMMPMPVFEVFASTLRRLVKGMPPTQADTGHFHHVLVKAGFSVRAICALYFVSSVVCCATGIWAWSNNVPEPLLFVGFLLLFGSWLIVIRNAAFLAQYLPIWLRRADASGH
jgi:UDP-GlcNAc:undecaprenyl-phosphate/decaprenyl-phosphate GlcNAc-1-phosphate transferase